MSVFCGPERKNRRRAGARLRFLSKEAQKNGIYQCFLTKYDVNRPTLIDALD